MIWEVSYTLRATGAGPPRDRPTHHRTARHASVPTSCFRRSAKGAWASSGWPSRRAGPPSWRSRSSSRAWTRRQVLARFEAERQALAMMDHPNIAKVLDAGMTDQGRPYFVMELVKGVPITEYCDEQHLPVRERLKLFVAGLPGGAARPSERASSTAISSRRTCWWRVRRPARAQGDRLRRGQGDAPAADREDACSRTTADGGHAEYMSPEQAETEPASTSIRAATSIRWACSLRAA